MRTREVAEVGWALAGAGLLSVGVALSGRSATNPLRVAFGRPWVAAGAWCFGRAYALGKEGS